MNKILLCCNSDIGRGNTIGFRFGKIAEHLKKEDIAFDIIGRSNWHSELAVKTPLYKHYLARLLNGLRIKFLPCFDFRPLDVWLFDRFVLRTLKSSKMDYRLAHLGEPLPNSINWLKNRGIKVLLDIPIAHYEYARHLEKKGFPLDNRIKPFPAFDRAIRCSDLLLVPSLFVKQSLEMAQVMKPMEIVPFGVDLPENFSEKDIEKKPNSRLRFIFAGNVNFRKGVNFLFRAWAQLNLENAELLICGRLYRTIRQELKKYKLKNIKLCGFVKLDKYFRESDVFVFPTLLEGSAKVVYEAMAYGLPVITTPNAGSIVEDNKSGFVIPAGDADKLAEKMLYFYQNPDKITEMGKNAFRKAKEYPWQKYSQTLRKCYEKFNVGC